MPGLPGIFHFRLESLLNDPISRAVTQNITGTFCAAGTQ
jgi:hypothetical protein